jgi:hypothetical protein
LISIFELVFAAFAAVLSVLSLKTLRTIKHLQVGKSFWMPVLASGIIFLAGSAIEILRELEFSLALMIPMADELVQASRILALCTLIVGVYSYSRQITKNLVEKSTAPQRFPKANLETDSAHSRELPTIQERLARQPRVAVSAHECQHQFGYLRTLAKDATLPDECLSCEKIIECKHSLAKAPENPATPSQ